mmetsp:Transcript_26967/g.87122  ORF Transcript_26967/g.87122 Transcript_26967/m.87122 type:complete len:355 (-) Transcript_26967:229-1293(-)
MLRYPPFVPPAGSLCRADGDDPCRHRRRHLLTPWLTRQPVPHAQVGDLGQGLGSRLGALGPHLALDTVLASAHEHQRAGAGHVGAFEQRHRALRLNEGVGLGVDAEQRGHCHAVDGRVLAEGHEGLGDDGHLGRHSDPNGFRPIGELVLELLLHVRVHLVAGALGQRDRRDERRQLVHNPVQVLVAKPERLEKVLLPDFGERDHWSQQQQPLHRRERRGLLRPQLDRAGSHPATKRDAQPEDWGAWRERSRKVRVNRKQVDGEIVEPVEVAAGVGQDRVGVAERLLVVREDADASALQHVDERVLVHGVGAAVVRRAQELVTAADADAVHEDDRRLGRVGVKPEGAQQHALRID